MVADRSWRKNGLSSITPGALLYAVVGAFLCALLQFYVQVNQADTRFTDSINQLVATVEEPSARSVLILDSELAEDIAKGLTKHDFVSHARILEDHGVTLGEAQSPTDRPISTIEAMVAPIVGSQQRITRTLTLPDSMVDASGEIVISYDRSRGVAALIGGVMSTVLLTFIITGAVIVLGFGLAGQREALSQKEA